MSFIELLRCWSLISFLICGPVRQTLQLLYFRNSDWGRLCIMCLKQSSSALRALTYCFIRSSLMWRRGTMFVAYQLMIHVWYTISVTYILSHQPVFLSPVPVPSSTVPETQEARIFYIYILLVGRVRSSLFWDPHIWSICGHSTWLAQWLSWFFHILLSKVLGVQ